jgi:hypothetical protein
MRPQIAIVFSAAALCCSGAAFAAEELPHVSARFDENCELHIGIAPNQIPPCQGLKDGETGPVIEIRVYRDTPSSGNGQEFLSVPLTCYDITSTGTEYLSIGPISVEGWHHAFIELWVVGPGGEAFPCDECNAQDYTRVAVAADLDCSGTVDVGDLLMLLQFWGTSDPGADLTGDGVVNVSDMLMLFADIA